METWVVGVILSVVELAITTIIGLIITRWWNKKRKEKEELERLREEQRVMDENSRFQMIKNTIYEELVEINNHFKSELKPITDDVELIKKTIQKDVRRSLRQDGKMYCDRGWASHQEKTEFDELYWAYHNLGKNGVVDSLHEKVMDLPDEPERR